MCFIVDALHYRCIPLLFSISKIEKMEKMRYLGVA